MHDGSITDREVVKISVRYCGEKVEVTNDGEGHWSWWKKGLLLFSP